MLVVHGLARILLQMQALDADFHVFELALIVRADRNHDLALADDRLLELRNLIALRQIRIEIVLAIENRLQIDLGIEPDARAYRLLDAFQIDDRQHARHGRINQRNIKLGSAPNEVEAPENSLDSDVTCAWTSMPMTTSQSPVAPEMKRFGSGVRVSIRVIVTRLSLPVQRNAQQKFYLTLAKTNGEDWQAFSALQRDLLKLSYAASQPGLR